ncbi:MAG: hypothetical protein RLZZ515_1944, partial [Cyanobacteriota bacterium]
AAVQLEHGKRVLRENATKHPERVADLACSTLEQTFLQQSIMRKATAHIAELELVMQLSADQATRDVSPAPAAMRVESEGAIRVPWLVRLVLRLYGFHLEPERS